MLASLSDADCRRYLRARDGKVEAAAAMACAALDWRVRMEIDKVGPADIPIALPQVRAFLHAVRTAHGVRRRARLCVAGVRDWASPSLW